MADENIGIDTMPEPETLEQAEQMTTLQNQQIHIEKIIRVAKEIEQILIRENMALGDWGQIVEMYSQRIGEQVSIIKVKALP